MRHRHRHTFGSVAAALLMVLVAFAGASRGDAPATAAATASSPAPAQAEGSKPKGKVSAAEWQKIPAQWEHITDASVRAELEKIAAMGSRAVGQEGHAAVRNYVRQQMQAAGLEPFEQHFYVTAPVDEGATLTVGDQKLTAYAVWPNGVVPSYAPPEGLTGTIIDGGNGDLTDLDYKPVKGSLVLLDFNSGKNWENAAKLGAKAILFRHPRQTTTSEATQKFFMVPLDMPRFLLSQDATAKLDAMLTAQRDPAAPLSGTLRGGASWKEVQSANMFAMLPGTDPNTTMLIIQCYMDSMSVAPASPHGADTALQLLAGLNVMRAMTAPGAPKLKSTVLFVFYDAHHHGLAGSREFAYLISQEMRSKGALQSAAQAAQSKARAIAGAVAYLAGGTSDLQKESAAVLSERVETLGKRGRMTVARELNNRQRELADAQHIVEALSPRKSQLSAEEARSLAEAETRLTELPKHVAYLRSLRDWYKTMDAMDNGIDRAQWLQKPPPVDLTGPLGAQYGYAVLTRDEVMASLKLLEGDADRHSDTARTFADTASRVFGARPLVNNKFLAVGLSLEPAIGADQLSWGGVENYGILSGAKTGIFGNMLAAQQKVISDIAAGIPLSQKVPLDDAFSIEASTTKGNSLAPNISVSNGLMLVGVTSYGLTAMNVSRTLVDTPADTLEHVSPVELSRATDTLRFLSTFVPHLARDVGQITLETKVNHRVTHIKGRVVEYDIQTNVLPDKPVPGALAFMPMAWLKGFNDVNRTIAGVRYDVVQRVDQEGRYAFHSLPDKNAKKAKDTLLYGFRLDGRNKIDYALDNSAQGTVMSTNKTERALFEENIDIVVAPARGLAIYDLIDPRVLTPLLEIRSLDALSMAKPKTFSYFFPKANDASTNGPYLENCGVIFGPPDATLVALISSGASGTRAAYLNLEEKPRDPNKPNAPVKYVAQGYDLDEHSQITFTALKVASDLVRLNEERLAQVREFGVKNSLLDKFNQDARRALNDAEERYAKQDYSGAYRQATHAWGVALRAYPQVASLGKDAVIGSVFFLALVLPFSFFMERLTIRAKTPNMRILGTLAWFAVVFTIMYFIHPAYAISSQPMIVLLAFIMITLVVIVFSIIYRKFVNLIRNYRNQLEGVHGADLKRFSASGVAVSLSLSTMARRKARTVLTGATLTMLAFAIVTFSSITTSIEYRQTPIRDVKPSYSGLMFHMPGWVNMPSSVYDSFRDEFGRNHTVLPRVWKLRAQDSWALQAGTTSTLPVTRQVAVDASGKPQYAIGYVNAVMGLSPDEREAFTPAQKLKAGTWLRHDSAGDAVISPKLAQELGITEADLDTPRASVLVEEQRFTVVGILDVDSAAAWRDLDGESIMPADFASAGADGKGGVGELDNLPTLDPSHPMPHLDFREHPVIIVQTGRALQMKDAAFKSVAVKFKLDDKGLSVEGRSAEDLLERLMQRLRIPVFAGIGDQSVLYESKDAHGLAGIGKLVVPILLAIFMIVNTLLGTVEERKDEIAMLNSVGLAPAHVGMLFLVEAIVYGILGLVIGYLVGLALAYTIVHSATIQSIEEFARMSLNYSSGATIFACIFVLMVVVASAWYPARAARKMATPGTLARWSLPESDDGTLTLEVPFTLTGGNALGMLGFLDEYLAGHYDATSPDFRIVRRAFYEDPDGLNGEPELVLGGDAFLAPYDLGVSEHFRICLRGTEQNNIFRVRFAIERIGGDMASFRRSTQRFLDLLRRQFLIWRTLEPAEKQKYVQRATEGFDAAARSAPRKTGVAQTV